ncbi:unnamed protein product [Amoebophrya sp. A25]|nr:unnamed protein product [Amoebophrya sp. A25]|eukprot:GSA25T00015496001.1
MQQRVGIVGATGAVGLEMLEVLRERNTLETFGPTHLRLYASKRSAGKEISCPTTLKASPGGSVTFTVIEFSVPDVVENCDILLLASSSEFAKEFVPQIHEKRGDMIIIDNSSAFRYDEAVPLVVPEVNGPDAFRANLIANPNCTTAIMSLVVFPLHKKYKVKRFLSSTYQAASGAGKAGMEELEAQMTAFNATGSDAEKDSSGATPTGVKPPEVFAYPLIANLIPQIDAFQANGYTKEEMKVSWETKKIFASAAAVGLEGTQDQDVVMEDEELKISCTAVRIPTLRSHAMSVTLGLAESFKDADEIRAHLQNCSKEFMFQVVDNPAEKRYPMPLTSANKWEVEVGRIRRNPVFDNGLDMFVCGDQLLRGAALNAVLIAELRMQNKA